MFVFCVRIVAVEGGNPFDPFVLSPCPHTSPDRHDAPWPTLCCGTWPQRCFPPPQPTRTVLHLLPLIQKKPGAVRQSCGGLCFPFLSPHPSPPRASPVATLAVVTERGMWTCTTVDQHTTQERSRLCLPFPHPLRPPAVLVWLPPPLPQTLHRTPQNPFHAPDPNTTQ